MRRGRLWLGVASAFFVVVFFSACSPDAEQSSASPPELPPLEVEDFSPAPRDNLQESLARARANPQDPEVNGNLGMLLHALDQHRSAVACYQRAIAFDSSDYRWPYYLAVAQTSLGEQEAAAESLRRALELNDRYVTARIRLAETLSALQQFEESERLWESAVTQAPQSAAAFFGLGQALAARGKPRDAVTLLRKACELAPDSGAAHYTLAMAYRDLGNDEMSRRHLQQAESLGREKPPLDDPLMSDLQALAADQHWFLNEGRRLEAAGRLPEAKKAYESALAIDEKFAPAHANLVGIYGRMGQFKEAETHYRRALELNAEIEELYNNWGIILALSERPQEAEQAFRRALDINPNSADAHVNIGSLAYDTGRQAEGVRHFRNALKNRPNHRAAHFRLGRHLVTVGNIDEGITHLEKSIEGAEDGQTPGRLYALADALARAGRQEAAVDYARRALRLAQRLGQGELAAAIRRDLESLESSLQ